MEDELKKNGILTPANQNQITLPVLQESLANINTLMGRIDHALERLENTVADLSQRTAVQENKTEDQKGEIVGLKHEMANIRKDLDLMAMKTTNELNNFKLESNRERNHNSLDNINNMNAMQNSIRQTIDDSLAPEKSRIDRLERWRWSLLLSLIHI